MSMSNNSNKQRPFYEAPKDRPTASLIIKQARTGLGAISTGRPDTPKTDGRSMFHKQSSVDSKPTSANNEQIAAVYNAESRPSSGHRLMPLTKNDSKIKSQSKMLNDVKVKRLSEAWENTDVERHKFVNVKTKTSSMSNLANVPKETTSNKISQSVAQSESFGSGLPPASPTRKNKRLRNKSHSQQKGDSSYNSLDQPERISSADSHAPSPNPVSYNSRTDSASSCSSASSCHQGVMRPNRNKSQSRADDQTSIDEVETPRPVEKTPDFNMEEHIQSVGHKKVSNSNKVDENDSQLFYKQNIRPILDILGAPVEYRCKESTDDFIRLTGLLYSNLDEQKMLGKHCPYRSDVLKAVFKVLDANNEVLIMSAARIILSMKVRDINLTNICKLIFKVAKNNKNDHLFQEFKMPELLLKTLDSIKPEQNHSSLPYLMCIMKFLTTPKQESTASATLTNTATADTDNSDDKDVASATGGTVGKKDMITDSYASGDSTARSTNITEDLFRHGLFNKISKLLEKTIDISKRDRCTAKKFSDYLKQCISCLINLEDGNFVSRKDFVFHRIPERITILIEMFHEDNELLFDASRLLSRLTQYSDCCLQIEGLLLEFCPRCLNIMLHCQEDQLVLRVAYIIGNLLAKSDDARHCLFPDKSNLESFLKVFQIYLKKFQQQSGNNQNQDGRNSGIDSSVGLYSGDDMTGINAINSSGNSNSISNSSSVSYQDVLVKLLRVIANAAIADSVGKMIASNKTCLKFILYLIKSKKSQGQSELLATSISTLNNISFYLTSSSVMEVKSHHMDIIEALYQLVVNKSAPDQEHIGLVIRVLGNLSREPYMRDWIIEKRLHEILITMLDSDDQDIVFFSVGVLLNLMTDENKRYILSESHTMELLIEVLRDYVLVDWQLAGLVCQTLWNYTETMRGQMEKSFGGEKNVVELLQLLSMFTDKEIVEEKHRAQCHDREQELEIFQASWQSDFYPVANDLLKRLTERLKSP